MSTRCQVIVRDQHGDELWFYRHSDGYPSGVAASLKCFVRLVRDGHIRNNVEQAAGWLVLLGAIEYQRCPSSWFRDEAKEVASYGTFAKTGVVAEIFANEIQSLDDISDWKVGAYEPCCHNAAHGDIAFAYLIELGEPEIYVLGLCGTKIDFDDRTPFAAYDD